MATTSRKVTITSVKSLTLPAEMTNGETGAYFIDALPLPVVADFSSAALLGIVGPNGPFIGSIAWSTDGTSVRVDTQGMPACTAVCGLAGGLVGFASTDEGVPKIQIHNTPVLTNNWDQVGTIVFDGVRGTIQAMAQHGDLLYGFIKSSPKNAFFIVKPQDGATPTAIYYDAAEAAFAFFPQSLSGAFIGVPRPLAFHADHMYAIGESHANVLYAALNGSSVVSQPLPKSDSWSLYIDDALKKAFGLYNATHGYVLAYDIQPDGTFNRNGHDTLHGGAANSPTLDTKLQLFYTASPFYGMYVFDAVTEQDITPRDLDSTLPGPLAAGGTWADTANSLLLVVGINQDKSQLGIYKVAVQPQ